MRHRLTVALVPPAAEELRHLVLECLLQYQPRSEPADHLDRVLLLADTGQRCIELCRETARSGLPCSCGRTSISFDVSGQSGGYARPFNSPGL